SCGARPALASALGSGCCAQDRFGSVRSAAGRVRFFFQAEDGIRVFHVTGVQTCALPILELGQLARAAHALRGARARKLSRGSGRSEERRVGKEWRPRWSPGHGEKKTVDCAQGTRCRAEERVGSVRSAKYRVPAES